jgi:hypothetical protein
MSDSENVDNIDMTNFSKWFEEKLIVEQYPNCERAKEFDIILNVSDEFFLQDVQDAQRDGKLWLWCPLGEIPGAMQYSSIFAALTILRQAEEQNLKVLLHCAAGRNRSPSVRAMYFRLRTGADVADGYWNGHVNAMYRNISNEVLPPKEKLFMFLEKVKYAMEHPQQFFGGTFDWIVDERRKIKEEDDDNEKEV